MKSDIDKMMSDPDMIRNAVKEITDEEFEQLCMGSDNEKIGSFFYRHILEFCKREIKYPKGHINGR